MSTLRAALLVGAKDLRIERRAKVTTAQILPFGAIVLIVFAFALDPDRGILPTVAPGLFWVAVLLASLLAVSRAVAIETEHSAMDGLRLSGLDPAAVFLGKTGAVLVQLLALEVVLVAGIVVLYDVSLRSFVPLVLATVAATIGIAGAGIVYGVLTAGLRLRETLVPLLVLPVVTPALLGATRAWEACLEGVPGEAWPWVGVLGSFAALMIGGGMLAFSTVMEEA